MANTTQNKNKRNALGRGLGGGMGKGMNALLGGTKTSDDNNNSKILGKNSKTIGNEKKQEVPENTRETLNKSPKIEPSKVVRTIGIEERILSLDIEKITTNKEQPRKSFEKESLQSLADSIKEQGVIQPITVKPGIGGTFEIVAGERRWRASQMAGLHKVPAIVKKIDEQKALEFALIENIQREDLNAIEEAMAYQHLMEKFDLNQSELGQKVGKDRATIANLLRLLNLAPEVKEMVINGEISMGQAKLILGMKDLRMQFKVARKVIKSKLSVKQTDKLIKKLQGAEVVDESNVEPVMNLQTQNLKSEIQKILGTKVKLNYENGKSKLQIQFYSDDELNSFIQNLRQAWNK